MLSEPREALPRKSTFILTAGIPALIDLTTIEEATIIEIDGAVRDVDLTPLKTKGIYTIQADVLTYCIAAPGRPRPSTFATERDDGNTLVVLKRSTAEKK